MRRRGWDDRTNRLAYFVGRHLCRDEFAAMVVSVTNQFLRMLRAELIELLVEYCVVGIGCQYAMTGGPGSAGKHPVVETSQWSIHMREYPVDLGELGIDGRGGRAAGFHREAHDRHCAVSVKEKIEMICLFVPNGPSSKSKLRASETFFSAFG
ncbi:MAG: hypothetical protein WC565_09180 [Parcubacteria group bacterium]